MRCGTLRVRPATPARDATNRCPTTRALPAPGTIRTDPTTTPICEEPS
ncbi:hypothetical protein [Streptomyces nogalater]|uniref:Uncharacterized protein n=1 Tax=Streptomyces nogalater TaxID=38314 RepID=A0ABW0WC62_STRNO